jgi:hypothetical protein
MAATSTLIPIQPIQVIPNGLMGLLQLKSLGQLPSILQTQVQPSLEMRDWYTQSRQVTQSTLLGAVPTIVGGMTTVGIAGFTPTVGPPVGFVWWVEQLTVTGQFAAAADTIRCLLVKTLSTSSTKDALGVDYTDNVNARTRQYVIKADRAFWMRPGESIAVQVNDILTASNVPASLFLQATPMQI